MAKSSKSCGYTGHMHVMNRKNVTKEKYNAQQTQSCGLNQQRQEEHPHHKQAYPEEKCNCNQSIKNNKG